MSQNTNIQSDEIKSSIEEILALNDLEAAAQVTYGQGSESGDGFNSKSFTVDATDGNGSLHLFCKAPLDQNLQKLPQSEFFLNEILFYNTIYPAYQLFLKEKCVEDGFRNVPKCYGIRGELIVLENLQRKGYNLFGKGKVINEDHIIETFKTFAKFHAVSFAMKDQKKEVYHGFVQNISCGFSEAMKVTGFDKMLAFGLREFLKALDPVDDKNLLDGCGNLVENLLESVLSADNCSNDYSIITQGDSWCNNIMYSYKEGNFEKPSDIMLVDWQLIRCGSPALDLSYFFYPIASEATIENIDLYLKIYHDELSVRMEQLGSDSETLYSYSVLKEEWKRFAKYGFAMSAIIIKTLVLETDEIPNTEDIENVQSLLKKTKNESQYIERMRMILKHFVMNNLL